MRQKIIIGVLAVVLIAGGQGKGGDFDNLATSIAGHLRAVILIGEDAPKLAEAFAAPLMLHSRIRDGSLRGAATERGATMLLFEGGEALRFDQDALTAGVEGIRRVLAELGVIDPDSAGPRPIPVESRSSSWVRARRSGIVLLDVELGEVVQRGQLLGVIHDSVGARLSRVTASRRGIVIGRVQQPLVNQGDALVHLAEVSDDVLSTLGRFVSTPSQDLR